MHCFRKKVRRFHCKVVLLDQQELIQEIQTSTIGQELLDNIFRHLNLIETAYFGLRFIDCTSQVLWLAPQKQVIKQLQGSKSFVLYFGVKFYAADPCKLAEEITRYQFFLQVKQDILEGRLPISNELSVQLAAYAVQSELGDHDSKRHVLGYVSEFRFVSNQTLELEAKIAEAHKRMMGQVPAVAELNYLEKVKWLDMYGVDLHPVLGENNINYFLGLTPSGIIVLRSTTKVGCYFWPRIDKITYKGTYFMLRVRNKSNEEQTFGFESPSKPACKHLFNCSVEHHAFFRLVHTSTINGSVKSASLNLRFRGSGKSDTSSVRKIGHQKFVRTPSNRYQRRVIEGALSVQDALDEVQVQPSTTCHMAVPEPIHIITKPSTSDSLGIISNASWATPTKITSNPINAILNNHKHILCEKNGIYDKIQPAGESDSSGEHLSHSRRRYRNRRSSDNESEVSRSSSRSRRHRHGASESQRDSESEAEQSSNRRHRRRRHHRQSSGNYQFVDSEVQWSQVQIKQVYPNCSQETNSKSICHVGSETDYVNQNSSTLATKKREEPFPNYVSLTSNNASIGLIKLKSVAPHESDTDLSLNVKGYLKLSDNKQDHRAEMSGRQASRLLRGISCENTEHKPNRDSEGTTFNSAFNNMISSFTESPPPYSPSCIDLTKPGESSRYKRRLSGELPANEVTGMRCDKDLQRSVVLPSSKDQMPIELKYTNGEAQVVGFKENIVEVSVPGSLNGFQNSSPALKGTGVARKQFHCVRPLPRSNHEMSTEL